MATVVRSEISEKNKYWISKHRHYELKHFCLQYPLWKQAYNEEIELSASSISSEKTYTKHKPADLTSKQAIEKASYSEKIEMIEKAAMEADECLMDYILKAVTEGLSYTYLKTKLNIPCGKDMYYDRYRRFFWLLSNSRN